MRDRFLSLIFSFLAFTTEAPGECPLSCVSKRFRTVLCLDGVGGVEWSVVIRCTLRRGSDAFFVLRPPRQHSGGGRGRIWYITDAAVRVIATTAKCLVSLSLFKNDRVTDNALHYLGARSVLEHINLNLCSKISDAGVGHLVAESGRLRPSGAAG